MTCFLMHWLIVWSDSCLLVGEEILQLGEFASPARIGSFLGLGVAVNNLVHGFACGAWCMAIVLTAASAAGVVVASLRTLDTKSVASEVFAVELLNHGISDFLVVDVGEAETATGTGFAVENSLERILPDAGELSFKLLLSKFCGKLPM